MRRAASGAWRRRKRPARGAGRRRRRAARRARRWPDSPPQWSGEEAGGRPTVGVTAPLPPTASTLYFPPELIPEVARHLTSLQDFFALRATCRAHLLVDAKATTRRRHENNIIISNTEDFPQVYHVFRWKFGEAKWERITEDCCVGYLGPHHKGIRGDSIYITERRDWVDCDCNGDWYEYSLDDGSFNRFFTEYPGGWCYTPSDYTPIWVLPSMY